MTQSISIIICSVSPEKSREVQKNIEKTIGVGCEFIIIDNRELKWPIAKVYNEGGRRAKSPYLFFVHEDTRFLCANWGALLIKKLTEPKTGVIGFAGANVRLNALFPYGWNGFPSFAIMNYIQGNGRADFLKTRKDSFSLFRTENSLHCDFTQVVVLDGMAMFVRKDLWQDYPFDEEFLTDFHCYDIDFTLVLHHQGYKNYICTSPEVLFLHDSSGYFSKEWFLITIAIHEKKWSKMLPAYTDDVDWNAISSKLPQYERKNNLLFIKNAMKLNTLGGITIYELVKKYSHLCNFRIRDILWLCGKYIWYRGFRL